MGGWCQTAVNHLTKEEMGNEFPLSPYSNITDGSPDKDGVLSLDVSTCGFFKSMHDCGCVLQLSILVAT